MEELGFPGRTIRNMMQQLPRTPFDKFKDVLKLYPPPAQKVIKEYLIKTIFDEAQNFLNYLFHHFPHVDPAITRVYKYFLRKRLTELQRMLNTDYEPYEHPLYISLVPGLTLNQPLQNVEMPNLMFPPGDDYSCFMNPFLENLQNSIPPRH